MLIKLALVLLAIAVHHFIMYNQTLFIPGNFVSVVHNYKLDIIYHFQMQLLNIGWAPNVELQHKINSLQTQLNLDSVLLAILHQVVLPDFYV